jgi:hypothetical protein
MVFTKVMVLKGYLLSIDEVFQLLEYLQNYMIDAGKYYKCLIIDPPNIKNKKEWLIENLYELNNAVFSRFKKIQLYTPPCCSKMCQEYYVLGHCVKIYRRLDVQCEKCTNYFCCDTCLGQTENGFYDMNKLFNEIVEVNEKHVCGWCNNDKKDELNNCKFCNCQKLVEDGMTKRFDNFIDSRLNKWASDKSIKYYYMLNDCLSCT